MSLPGRSGRANQTTLGAVGRDILSPCRPGAPVPAVVSESRNDEGTGSLRGSDLVFQHLHLRNVEIQDL